MWFSIGFRGTRWTRPRPKLQTDLLVPSTIHIAAWFIGSLGCLSGILPLAAMAEKKIGAFVSRPYLHLPPILDHGEWARFTVGEVDEAGLRLCQVGTIQVSWERLWNATRGNPWKSTLWVVYLFV